MQVDPAEASLGRLLFYDPILSGNRNISCGTCHNHDYASTDGVALGFGEGGNGLGPAREQGTARQRQSRNAPGLWNLGARGVTTLFHDGRVFVNSAGVLRSPAGAALPKGLSGVVAAQALFPMIARSEMAGDPMENPVAAASETNVTQAWHMLARRVANTTAYAQGFREFDQNLQPNKITITHIANALSAFVRQEWQAINTPFDQFLRGDRQALNAAQKHGMDLFFGRAECATCHSGSLLSDQSFHALGLAQFGPGLTRRFDPVARDVGRMAVTDLAQDAYRFRTPMLRNVALTGPFGHNGAYGTLAEMILHHAAPDQSAQSWTPQNVLLPKITRPGIDDFAMWQDSTENQRIRQAVTIQPVRLTETEIADLEAFLHALTDSSRAQGRLGKPASVPSGLPVD